MHALTTPSSLLVAASLLLAGLAPLSAQAPPADADAIHPAPTIEWESIAELPPRPGLDAQGGLAGVFAGAQDDVFILAGGTNYPGAMPWQGGQRAWWSDIYVMERHITPDNTWAYQWLPAGAELPENLAYGASVSLPDGVLCIGGAELNAVSDACFLLHWNKEAKKIEIQDFPKLPRALACLSAVRVKDTVYAIGGTTTLPSPHATTSFYALDLTKRDDAAAFVWKALPPWDGPGRIFPEAAASLEGEVEGIYLCGGRDPGNDPDFLTDLHRFNPARREWSILGNIVDPAGHPCSAMGAPVFHVPPHHLVLVSGTDPELVKLIENNERDLEMVDPAELASRARYNDLLLQNYPGYTRTVMAYDAQAGEWTHIGTFPGAACLTTPTVVWDGSIIIPGGETGPGRRSTTIWMGTVRKKAAVVE